jgi:hypothetical protein
MSDEISLNYEDGSENEFKSSIRRLYFREGKTEEEIRAKIICLTKEKENQNSGKLNSKSKNAKTKDLDYIFQDPELEAKFFSFLCSSDDLCTLSYLNNVGIFNWTVTSLVFGVFWFYRVTAVEENSNSLKQHPLIIQKLDDFKHSIEKIESFGQLDKENEKELEKLDRLFPIIKGFVCESAGKISSESFIALHELFTFALKYDPDRIAKACLAFALEGIVKHADIKFPMEPLYSFRLLSVHNAEPKPTLTFEDWWYFYEKYLKKFKLDNPCSKFILRMLGAHGPNKVRNEILKYNLRSQILEPLFYKERDKNVLRPASSNSDWSENFPWNKSGGVELKIPEVDLMHVDCPEFDEKSGVFKITDRYITFVEKIEDYINSGERSDSLKIKVFTKWIKGSEPSFVRVTDAGGITRSFITSFSCLFKVHPLLLVESNRGSVALHPMATGQVYAFLANLFGLLAVYNYKEDRRFALSINWFLNPRYAEFMFDTNLDRIPTIEEIYLFFPHLIKEFEVCCQSPEDLGSRYDLRQEITMTSIINHVNVHQLGEVAEPKDVAELTKLKDDYLEHIQLKLHQSHIIFIRNLNTYFGGKLCDYENFDLLIVRRNELTAEEVLNAIELDNSCMRYKVAYEDKTINNMKIAFTRMVREMSSDERANLFHFGMGGVPTILGKNILRLSCEFGGCSSQSWSASSCSGVLFPPRPKSEELPVSYQMLYDSLRMQSAMDYGSTSGNENRSQFASVSHEAESNESESSEAQPDESESSEAESSETEYDSESSETEPDDSEPSEAQPDDSESSEAESSETEYDSESDAETECNDDTDPE